MHSTASLSRLTDRELLERLRDLAHRGYALTAELLAHLAEVETRQLCEREADGSLFAYCVGVLHFSEGEAYNRITAARAGRAYPVILEMVGRGELHVTAVRLLAPHLTPENHRELLAAAVHKSKREVLQLIAARFPKPDAPTVLRKLPDGPAARSGRASAGALEVAGASVLAGSLLAITTGAATRGADAEPVTAPAAAVGPGGAATLVAVATPASAAAASVATLGASAAPSSAFAACARLERPPDRGSVAPLAADRFRLQVTIDAATRDNLLRAQALMRHQQPDGDLAVVLSRALSGLVAELERRKFGRRKRLEPRAAAEQTDLRARVDQDSHELEQRHRGTECHGLVPERVTPGASERIRDRTLESTESRHSKTTPRAPSSAESRAISLPMRRAVAERDDYRCTHVGPDGRRCQATAFLEFHHIVPHALGGKTVVENLTLRCRVHNGVEAVHDFGAERMARHRKKRGLPAAGRLAGKRPTPAASSATVGVVGRGLATGGAEPPTRGAAGRPPGDS